jgi:hypothetical protein
MHTNERRWQAVEEIVNDRRLQLSLGERLTAEQAAVSFLTYADARPDYTPVKGWKDDDERKKQLILAYASEIGVAKKLKKQWNGVNTGKRQADVGDNIEVRWTSTEYAIIYDYDRDTDIIFVVKGASINDLYIVGFMPVQMAKVDAYRKEREGLPVNWFVPLSKLYTYLPNNHAVTAFIDRFSALL